MQPSTLTIGTFTAFSIPPDGSPHHFVRLHDGATERLERDLLARAGSTPASGGILWGSSTRDSEGEWFDVVSVEPVRCDKCHANFWTCPVCCLETTIRAGERNGHKSYQAIGYYRTGSIKSFRGTQHRFNVCSSENPPLILIVEAHQQQPATGIFLLGVDGEFDADLISAEFPVSMLELTGAAAGPEPLQSTTDSHPVALDKPADTSNRAPSPEVTGSAAAAAVPARESTPEPRPEPAVFNESQSLRERLASQVIDYTPAAVARTAPVASAPAGSAASSYGSTFRELLEEGMTFFRKGDYAVAVESWRRARQLDPENRLLAYNLRVAEQRLGGDKR